MRLYDSLGTTNQNKMPSTPATTTSGTLTTAQMQFQQQQRWNITKLKQSRNYYRGEDTRSPQEYKFSKFNVEQSWNPVNNYIYGPTANSIYNNPSEKETHRKFERILNHNSLSNREKGEKKMVGGGGGGGFDRDRDFGELEKDFLGKTRNRGEKTSSRRLLGEFVNNEAPKLCDHAINDYLSDSQKMRYCTPLESYVSTGRDMVSSNLDQIISK
jgi:hypothetical protein